MFWKVALGGYNAGMNRYSCTPSAKRKSLQKVPICAISKEKVNIHMPISTNMPIFKILSASQKV